MPQREHKLDYRETAKNDLWIIGQTHIELVGPISAQKITDKITGNIKNLRVSPYLGMPCRNKALAKLGYRFLVCGNYLAFYRVIGETVCIYHILDGRTNYEKRLGSLPS